jgi:hypothetical protein
LISPPMAKVAIGFCIAGSVPVQRRLVQGRVAPPVTFAGRVQGVKTRASVKRPAEAGVSSSQFGAIFKTPGIGADRVAVQLRLALLDAIQVPGFKTKQNSIIIPLATVIWRKRCPPY